MHMGGAGMLFKDFSDHSVTFHPLPPYTHICITVLENTVWDGTTWGTCLTQSLTHPKGPQKVATGLQRDQSSQFSV